MRIAGREPYSRFRRNERFGRPTRFEQDLARLINDGLVTRNEGLSQADSPNNLLWRLQNDFQNSRSGAEDPSLDEDSAEAPSFTEFSLDVKF